jgi:hypothetical protein
VVVLQFDYVSYGVIAIVKVFLISRGGVTLDPGKREVFPFPTT